MGLVITVSGSVGGIGASTLAYALALQGRAPSVLIDGQSDGAPIDLLLGAEGVPGARWSQVRVQSGAISAPAVLTALPEFHGVHVLSADREGSADVTGLAHLVAALREACSLVVIDLPARHPAMGVIDADLHLLALPPTIVGIGAALVASAASRQLVVVDIGRSDVAPTEVRQYLDHDVIGVVRWQRAVTMAALAGEPLPATTDVMRVAALILEGLRDDA